MGEESSHDGVTFELIRRTSQDNRFAISTDFIIKVELLEDFKVEFWLGHTSYTYTEKLSGESILMARESSSLILPYRAQSHVNCKTRRWWWSNH